MIALFDSAVRTVRALVVGGAVVPLLLLTAVSLAAAVRVRRTGRSDRHVVLLFAAFASLGLVVGATLLREAGSAVLAVLGDEPFDPPGPAGLLDWSPDGWRRLTADPFSAQVLLNVLLFVPAGAAWTILTLRPLRVLSALAGLSVAVECLQAVSGLGAPDVADLLANTVGAAAGVATGAAAVWVWPPWRPRGAGRRWGAGAAIATVALACLLATVPVVASGQQDRLADQLRSRFAATTAADYAAWESEGRLDQEVFSAVPGVVADSAAMVDGQPRVRFPASFLGSRRCVFVDWTGAAARVTQASGAPCTAAPG